MIYINQQELDFIESLGLLLEKSGGSKTLGRIFGYLLLAEKPKTLDDIAKDLLFSKATASLTIRQGMTVRFFEKVSVPGERRDYYRANIQSWINSMTEQIKIIDEWEKLMDFGLSLLPPGSRAGRENIEGMKDYMSFIRWYYSDIFKQYDRWKKGEIGRNS